MSSNQNASRPSGIKCKHILDTSDSESDNVETPRFVPSPHPDMIRRPSTGSGSSKFKSAESSRRWGISGPSGSPALFQFNPIHYVEAASNGESLLKSRYTYKTPSNVSGNSEKIVNRSSMDVSSEIDWNRRGKQPTQRQSVGELPRDFHSDDGTRFECVSDSLSSSDSHVEPMESNDLNFQAIPSNWNRDSRPALSGLLAEPSVSGFVPEMSRNDGIRSLVARNRHTTPCVDLTAASGAAVGASYRTNDPYVLNLQPQSVRGRPGTPDAPPSTRMQFITQRAHQSVQTPFANVVVNPVNQQPSHQAGSVMLPAESEPRTVGGSWQSKPQSRSGEQEFRPYPMWSPVSRQNSLHQVAMTRGRSETAGPCSPGVGQLGNNVRPDQSPSRISSVPPNLSHEDNERPTTESDFGVILSLVHKKNKVAGSSYNSSTGQVHLLETVMENSDYSNTLLALRSVSPDIVVVPSSGAARFVQELKGRIEGDATLKDCQFQCLSPRFFAYTFARRTILESSLWEGCLTFRSEDAKRNAIVSTINLNDERLVCAFGGLLYHLSTGCPQLRSSPSPISSVQHMKLDHKLRVDAESFKFLQIFDPAEHPSSFKWSSNRDDGKSIFGLFERFCSSVGMSRLKSFLANPVNCRRTIERRHEVIDFYVNPNNFNAVEALRGFTSQMSSSSVVMNYLSSPTLRGGHWKHIYRHIYYTVSYAEVCRAHGAQSELFGELGSSIVESVYSMAHNLEKVVDLANMETNETFVIKYGFHPLLDAAKEKFSRLKMAMDKVTPYEFDSVPPFITRIQMMYIPEMKFLLSIPYWAPDLSKDDLLLPNLEYKFTANKTAFYKTRRCYELDELLGDAQTDIINEESMIIQSLKNYLKKHMHHIVGMGQKIAEIECIFAMAKVAREERFTRPEILNDGVVDIRGGRHPLLDVPSNTVITNDVVSSADTSLVKLIYGPNASGKSVYLKTIGLIVYLIHVGSYVPAASVRAGLFSRILARSTTEESVISMSSRMLSELKKLQDSVTGTKDSLVILDEIGKGSTEDNCIAIVTSAVNYFLSQGSDCPHVLISSHLSGISDFVEPPPGGRNVFELLIMDYTITEGDIVFLFKARRGRPESSFEVFENSEFAPQIVKTARTVLESLRSGENLLPYCQTRIQRSHKYLNFVRKFVNIDMAKPGYLEKLQNKIQRYYEKPSH